MGRRPFKCYRQIKNKPYQVRHGSKKKLAVRDPKRKIKFDVGNTKADATTFPFNIHIISWEKENISSEAIEASREAANKFMKKNAKKDAYHIRVRVHPFHTLRVNKMLTCAGADRLQTGMRNAFGKPYGTSARVKIGQILLSIRCRDNNANTAREALKRAKFKFPGRQKIVVSHS